MLKKVNRVVLFLALCLLPLSTAKAAGTKAAENIYVPKEEIVSGNLYAAGQSITIDGNISGDLIVAGQSIVVNGRVDGDVIAAAQDITINGEVGGNIRVAGNSLNINNAVARNVNAFGANIVFGPNAHVGWDAYVAGANVTVRGAIEGDLSGYAAQSIISGKIGKNIDLKLNNGGEAQKLTIASGATIGGNLEYTSQAVADVSADASISGTVNHKLPIVKEVNLFWPWVFAKLFMIGAALVIGLLLILTGKKTVNKMFSLMEKKPGKAILTGLLIFFVTPPAALILMITIIGIPLALVLGALWMVAIYVGKIIAAIFLGNLLIKNLFKKKDQSLVWSLLPGVIFCWLIFAIPFIGWLLGLVAIWLGLGGIWLYATNKS